MRALKLLAVAGLALTTAACVESVDGNMGYSNGYYAPNQAYSYGQSGYYTQPGYSPTYSSSTYYAPTQIVRETRYVPVPTPVPQRPFSPPNRWNDHHEDGNRNDANHGDHHDRPQATNAPPPHQAPQPAPGNGNNQHGGNSQNGSPNGSHDRDGDGRPDRRS